MLEEVAASVGAKTIQAGQVVVVSQWGQIIDELYAVAIAYVMQKVPYVFPILGGRKIEHLYNNLEALDIVLKEEHIKKIEAASPFDKGMMYNLFVSFMRMHYPYN